MILNEAIFETLRESYLLTVADLAIYPDGSPEHIDAEHRAAHTSRAAFEICGKEAADALREEGVKKWRKIRGLA